METHFAGFLFSKKLEKRTLWLKSLLKQYPSFTILWSWLFIFTLNLLTQIHIWQLLLQYSSLYVIYGFLRLTKKSAKSLESIKFCRNNLRNLARFFLRTNTKNDNRIYYLCNHTFVILTIKARLSSLAFLAKLHKLHLPSDTTWHFTIFHI